MFLTQLILNPMFQNLKIRGRWKTQHALLASSTKAGTANVLEYCHIKQSVFSPIITLYIYSHHQDLLIPFQSLGSVFTTGYTSWEILYAQSAVLPKFVHMADYMADILPKWRTVFCARCYSQFDSMIFCFVTKFTCYLFCSRSLPRRPFKFLVVSILCGLKENPLLLLEPV